ncbi:hypothetical protein CMV_021045 [Castanea mollissima]|uniref:Uncharacterized protein n=1 Tax=Castanea mollissima TaxID=60419 RepID=A0A8J4QLZ7_9ROSI|nr:hypothetical protein CMV_021045 [Castanea mollissima]
MASAADRSVVSSFVAAKLMSTVLLFEVWGAIKWHVKKREFKSLDPNPNPRFLNAALDIAIRLKDSILEAIYNRLISDEALSFIEAFHLLLGELALFPTALIGLHFQVLGVSPLNTHFAIIVIFFMTTIIHHIAYMWIKLQPQDAGYLSILRFICLVSGIIAIELLFAIIISPFWLFMVNLCPILILGKF